MDDAIAAVAVFVLVAIAFRRLRQVVGPPRRPPKREPIAARVDRTVTTIQVAARVAVALIILSGVVWLTWQLFD